MFTGIFALLVRSLRADARDHWAHGFRFAAVIVGYAAAFAAAANINRFAAPGLNFFQTLVTLNVLLIAAAGLSYFATVITEEKEEGTLGLMQMTGLSGIGILLGKSGSRMLQAMLLVLLQVPFALLGITLGGVTLPQVQAVTVALLSLLFLVANLALFVSVVSRNSREAAFRMTVVIVGYCIAAWIAQELRQRALTQFTAQFSDRVVVTSVTTKPVDFAMWEWLNDAFLFRRIGNCLESGVVPQLLTAHEVVNVAVGLLAFGLAWTVFAWATRQPDHDVISRGWLGIKAGRWRWLTPGRVGLNAVYWKEFHFQVGGWPRVLLKFAGYSLGASAVWWYWNFWNASWQTWQYHRNPAVEACVIFSSLLLAWEAALVASSTFHGEIRGKTWSTLVSTPIPFGELCYSKVIVAFASLFPVGIWLCGLLLFTETGREGFEEVCDDPIFWAIVLAFAAVAHLATLFSLHVRWGAVPLAFAAVWLTFLGAAMLFVPVGPEDEFGVGMILLWGFVCLACHGLVGHRLRQLASE